MTDWRDDLPPIPSERIRLEAMHEGRRRREARARRERAVLFGGAGTAVVALIIFIAVQSDTLPSENAGDDAAGTAEETAAAATTAPATAAEASEAPATESPATTEFAAATTAAPATTAAAEETTGPTSPNYTTVAGSIAALPPSDDVVVTPSEIWEQPVSGNSECGPTTVTVVFQPEDGQVGSPVVHWEVTDVQGQDAMVVEGERATATVGPFPPDTLIPESRHEVLIAVIDPAVTDEIFRAPVVVLRDCAP